MDPGVGEMLDVELADEVPGAHINYLATRGGYPLNGL